MSNKQQYNSGVREIFSNFSRDPCLNKSCVNVCPVGFTCMRAAPPRFGELRLDFFGCNLKCPFCWTINKPLLWSPDEVHEYIRCRFDKYYNSGLGITITYLRITGGEPILSEERINHLLDLFSLIDSDIKRDKVYSIWKARRLPQNIRGRKNIKIQTNGLMIPSFHKEFIGELKNFENISFTFEVSLKGTNPCEFAILTGGLSGEKFFEQVRAIEELIEYEKQGYPLFVRGILGIFHSEQYDLIFPRNGKMMLNPSKEFINIVNALMHMPRPQERFYVEPLRFTEQMSRKEEHCRKIGIITSPSLGKGIKAGKKIPMKNTYLWKLLH